MSTSPTNPLPPSDREARTHARRHPGSGWGELLLILAVLAASIYFLMTRVTRASGQVAAPAPAPVDPTRKLPVTAAPATTPPVAPPGTAGKPPEVKPPDTKPTVDPAVEAKGFILAPDLEVTLYAHEPRIVNPIAMNFDERGRLWVACSPSYPQVVPGKEPNDYIVVLEDTNADGQIDKHTLFADHLYMPSGFALGDGGVYVANPPDLLFLKDTDGDGKADLRRVLLSGFGTEENHHCISNWRWSPTGKLIFMQGAYLKSNVETPYGVVRLNEVGGAFSFSPRRHRLGIYFAQASNPWSHAYDEWGRDVLGEAPEGGLFDVLPNTLRTLPSERAPPFSAAPKSSGIEFLYSRMFPADWQGDLIVNAFKSRSIHRFKLTMESPGSTFTAKEIEPPLLKSEDPNFRPVDVKMGPDGAIYVLDWYSPLIGHMQYNFRDPLRDNQHGRIWRIARKDAKPLALPKIAGATPAELCQLLASEESCTRHLARRAMVELDPMVVGEALKAFVEKLPADDPRKEHHKLEALWAYSSIDVVELPLLKQVLQSSDARARAAAIGVLRDWRNRISADETLKLLEPLADDADGRVRLEVLVTLTYFELPQAVELAQKIKAGKTDANLDFVLKHALPALEAPKGEKK